MENQNNKRLLYDRDCNKCEQVSTCEWNETTQCCRRITDKLRKELTNNRKRRKIIKKIIITFEYIYTDCKLIKKVAKEGAFILQEPYWFPNPFLRAEIQGKCNGGIFKTEYFKWNN